MTRILLILSFWLIFQSGSFAQKGKKGFLPEGSSYMVIMEPSQTAKTTQLVFSSNYKFPFLLTDGKMVLLSDDEVEEPIAFSIPNEIKDCENVFILDSILICKKKTTIKSFDGESIENMLIMPDKQYNIFPANNGFFYLVRRGKDSSSVYLVETATGEFMKLFDAPFLIDNIAGTGPSSYVTSNEMIYYVSEEICTLIEVSDSKVKSIDFFSEGVFYSTEKACYYMGLPGKSFPFLLGDIKQLMLVDNRLYLLFKNGLLSVIDNANQYQTFLEATVNDENK